MKNGRCCSPLVLYPEYYNFMRKNGSEAAVPSLPRTVPLCSLPSTTQLQQRIKKWGLGLFYRSFPLFSSSISYLHYFREFNKETRFSLHRVVRREGWQPLGAENRGGSWRPITGLPFLLAPPLLLPPTGREHCY